MRGISGLAERTVSFSRTLIMELINLKVRGHLADLFEKVTSNAAVL
jgi:hypothetical protein